MVNVSGLRIESDKDRTRNNRRKNYIARVEVCVYHNKKQPRTKSRAELFNNNSFNASSADDLKKNTKSEDFQNSNSFCSEAASRQGRNCYMKQNKSAYRVYRQENVSNIDGLPRYDQFFDIGIGIKDQPQGSKTTFGSDQNIDVKSNFVFSPLLTLFDHIKTQNGDEKLINLDYYRLYSPMNTKTPSEIDEVSGGVNPENNKKNASVETIHCQRRRKFSCLTKCRSDLNKAVDDFSVISQKTETIPENDYLYNSSKNCKPSSTSITSKDTKRTISCILRDDLDYVPSPPIRSMSSFIICSCKVNKNCCKKKHIKKRSPKQVRTRSKYKMRSKTPYSASDSLKESENINNDKTENSLADFLSTNDVNVQCESFNLNKYRNSESENADIEQHEIIEKLNRFQRSPDLSNYVCMYANTQNMFKKNNPADMNCSNEIQRKIDINISPSKVTCKEKTPKKMLSKNSSPFKHRKGKIQRLDDRIVKPIVLRKSLRRLKVLNDYLQKFRFERSLPQQTQSVFQLYDKQYINTIFRVMQDYKHRRNRFTDSEVKRKKSNSETSPNLGSNITGPVQFKHISNPTKIYADPTHRKKGDGTTADEFKSKDIGKNKPPKDINFVVNINIQTEKKNIKDRSVECVKNLGDPNKNNNASKQKDFAQLTSKDFMAFNDKPGLKTHVSSLPKSECKCKKCQDRINKSSTAKFKTRATEAGKSMSFPIIDSESFLRVTDMTEAASLQLESSENETTNKNLIQTQTKISNTKINSGNKESSNLESLEFAPYAKFSETNADFKWKPKLNVKNETYMTVLQKPKFAFSESTVEGPIGDSVAKLSTISVVSGLKPPPITNALPPAVNILHSLFGHIYITGGILVLIVIMIAAAMFLLFHDNGNLIRSYYFKTQNIHSDNVVDPKAENSPYYQYSLNELGF